jgi:polysaccharide deacetylase 2 family uncharacterized protein YibQ
VCRRLSRHEDRWFRATLGAILALWAWVLWPDFEDGGFGWGHQQSIATRSPGSAAAVPGGLTLSAKSHLAGTAVAAADRVERRLPQIGSTMPEIGVPETSALPAAASAETPPPASAAPELSVAAAAGAPASDAPALTAAALGAEAVLVGRAEAAIEPAAPPPAKPGAVDGAGSVRDMPELSVAAAVLPHGPAEPSTPAWLRNAVPSTNDGRPAIAVVIDDMGFNRRAAAVLNRLPGPLTLAFLPYATKLDEQSRAARAAGHELLVHVPMEPRGQESPGPNALTSQLDSAELISRLRTQLRSFRGFVGINNHMGSLLTADPGRMTILMAELRRQGLLFLDSRTTSQSVAAREAARIGVPHALRDVFIDHNLDRASVLRALERVARIALDQGHAVAIGHPHDVTIAALEAWLPTLEARNIALVPISAIVARRSCASGTFLVANACARYAVGSPAPAATVPIPRT